MRAALARLRRALAAEGRVLLPVALLLVLALVLPPLPIQRLAYDHVVVFDVTQSMNVEDYTLDGRLVSRLDYAKHAIAEELRNPDCDSRIGWGIFAGRKLVMLLAPVEVCGNYAALLAALEGIDTKMAFEQASEIQDGLYWIIDNLHQLKPFPDLIFMTDGHEAPPLAEDLQRPFDGVRGEIRGWVIGVGGLEAKPIPKNDPDGKRVGYWHDTEVFQLTGTPNSHEHLSELHEEHLQQLANNVGFKYRRLTDVASLHEAMHDRSLAHLASVLTDLRWIPGLLAVLLLAWRYRPDGLRRAPSASAADAPASAART